MMYDRQGKINWWCKIKQCSGVVSASWQSLAPPVSHLLNLSCAGDGEQCSWWGGKRDLSLTCPVVHTWVFPAKSPGSSPPLVHQMADRSHRGVWQELLPLSLLPAMALHRSHGVAFELSPTVLCLLYLPWDQCWETILFYFCPFSAPVLWSISQFLFRCSLCGCCFLHPLTCSFPSLAAASSCPSHKRRYS